MEYSGGVPTVLKHCNHCLGSCNETLRCGQGIKAFEMLIRHDETPGFKMLPALPAQWNAFVSTIPSGFNLR
jgi:hypothetical protein